MKERVRFAVGAASMVLAACCLMGALFTAWLRCAAGAVTQAAGWAVMQQLRSQSSTLSLQALALLRLRLSRLFVRSQAGR